MINYCSRERLDDEADYYCAGADLNQYCIDTAGFGLVFGDVAIGYGYELNGGMHSMTFAWF
jgi:hypothetical protein